MVELAGTMGDTHIASLVRRVNIIQQQLVGRYDHNLGRYLPVRLLSFCFFDNRRIISGISVSGRYGARCSEVRHGVGVKA